MDANKENFKWGTWSSIGKFEFNDQQYFKLWIVTVAGSFGFMMGHLLAKKMGSLMLKNRKSYSNFVRQNVGLCLLIWFVLEFPTIIYG